MYWVYFLKSEKDNSLYIGHTNDVSRRIAEHNRGQTQYLKSKRPLVLLQTIECESREAAIRLEKEWKKGYKREEIRRKYNLK